MMRWVRSFGLVGLLALASCDGATTFFASEPITTTTIEGRTRTNRNGGEQIRVWRDPGTGCQYLLWERLRRGGMTPRLNPDGRPMCGAVRSGREPTR